MHVDYRLKVCVVGDSGVGKTSLIARFTDGVFLDTAPTIGIDTRVKSVDTDDARTIQLCFWDTAGQEKFRALTSSFYRNAAIVALCFDLSSRASFESLNYWLDEGELFAAPSAVKILIGTKNDADVERVVGLDEALRFATDRSMLFVETSAKRGSGVVDAFQSAAKQVLLNDAIRDAAPSMTTIVGDEGGGGYGCCY